MNEIWKEIPGYSNYLISNKGRIWSKFKNREVFPNITSEGYLRKMGLRADNGKIKHELVHRLVAITFIPNPNPESYDIINHIDSNRQNNCVENLEWTNKFGNLDHARKAGRRDNMKTNPGKRVVKMDKDGKVLAEYETLTKAAEDIGRSLSSLCSALRGDSKTCAGYYWKYKED